MLTSPQVRFHFNVPDRLGYVLRLLRKSMQQRLGATVLADAPLLDALSQRLWTWDDLSFIAHWRVRPGVAVRAPNHQRIWLLDDLALQARPQPVLIQLKAEPVEDVNEFGAFEKLIDVVSLDADERDAGRRRWKAYQRQGWRVEAIDAQGGGV
jgi:DNA polymerase-3 subunit chi